MLREYVAHYNVRGLIAHSVLRLSPNLLFGLTPTGRPDRRSAAAEWSALPVRLGGCLICEETDGTLAPHSQTSTRIWSVDTMICLGHP